MTYRSTKTYNHEVGLSCCFRQHRAHSHCNQLHGYALAVKFEFEATVLEGGWVVDFGSMKSLKGWLEDTFDHKLLVAEDDPMKDEICVLGGLGIASVVMVEATGCEAFAKLIFECAVVWLQSNGYSPRCKLVAVEVREHGANSAIYIGGE
jgi:6-pyruvoyltetrahydropterin/6-carboxytetrahydropterin synthase